MIAIIDFGMGNLGSIKNMLERIGEEAEFASERGAIESADKLILPGMGAFDNAVQSIERLGMRDLLDEMVLHRKKPILGICLGMQLMTRQSEEGKLPGFGWIDAETLRFDFREQNPLRVPHMGWNVLNARQKSPILADMEGDGESRFYFAHSYHVRCADEENVLATTEYGIDFHSAIVKENIFGVQFHPEKSHKFGMRLMENFCEYEGA